jgi:hypothetical protein
MDAEKVCAKSDHSSSESKVPLSSYLFRKNIVFDTGDQLMKKY